MILHYLIDWPCIDRRLEDAYKNNTLSPLYLFTLASNLQKLSQHIRENGILISEDEEFDNKTITRIVTWLQNNIGNDDENLTQVLNAFLNLKKNSEIVLNGAPIEESYITHCANEFCKLAKSVGDSNDKVNVIISDDKYDIALFTVISMDDYEKSPSENVRKEWFASPIITNTKDNEEQIMHFLNAFSLASLKQEPILVIDPYIAMLGVAKKDQPASNLQQRRWIESAARILSPFIKNPNVTKIVILSKFPEEECSAKNPFCLDGSDGKIKEENSFVAKIGSISAQRSGDLDIVIKLLVPVKDQEHVARFHNRKIICGGYVMLFPDGMDICDENGHFLTNRELGFWGKDEKQGKSNLTRANIFSFQPKEISSKEIFGQGKNGEFCYQCNSNFSVKITVFSKEKG